MMKIPNTGVLAVILFLVSIGVTQAHFTNTVIVEGNQVTAGTWSESSTVVINEVMWMGSTASSADEWIELRNLTDDPIDISGWKIERAASSSGTLIIEDNTVIPANGYFVIANYSASDSSSDLNITHNTYSVSSLSLSNSGNGNLVLKDSGDNVIDEVKGDEWPAGSNEDDHQSMQRAEVPGDGLQLGNWHTCTATGCQDGAFWKTVDGDNYGTPGAANITE